MHAKHMYLKDLYLSSKKKKLTSKTLNRFFKEDKERIRTHHQGLETATLRTYHMHTRTSTFQDGSTKS